MRKSIEQAIMITGATGFGFWAGATMIEAQTLPSAAGYLGLAIGSALVVKKQMGTGRRRRSAFTFARDVTTIGDVQTWVMKWKEEKPALPDEFYFWGNGLPDKLPEHVLMRFCKIGFRRQALVQHKTLVRDGEEFKRIKAKDILSKKHFLGSARFAEADYNSCIYILSCTWLLTGRRAGTSGRLLETPGRTVDLARSRWAALASPRPRRKLFSFIPQLA